MFKSNYLTQFNDEHNDWIEAWLDGKIDSVRLEKHLRWVFEIVESHRTYQKQERR